MPNPDSPASPTIEPVLPPATVTWLWERLAVRYGRRFVGIWDGVDLGAVQEEWAYELRRLSDEQLQWAVQNLPDEPPPTSAAFRKHCLSMPDPQRLKLPHRVQPGIPPAVRAAMEALKEPDEDKRPTRVKWAESYVGRYGGQIHLTPFQKDVLSHARAVLRRWEKGGFDDPEAARAAADERANTTTAGADTQP